MKARSLAREAAQLATIRHLRHRRAEAVHGESTRRTAEARATAEAAAQAHQEGEQAWAATLEEPRLAFGLAAAWGALLRTSHAEMGETADAADDAAAMQDRRAAEAAQAGAERDIAEELAARLGRRRRRAEEERALAAYDDAAAARRRRP
ncbi:MAG TPA: hypothetical protein VKI45_11735 [Allosphingosinicella sp.]|nr:hypothetical protein [Allosphingosinicella sp.]